MLTTRLLTALLTAAAFTALPTGPAAAQPVAPQAVPANSASPDFDGDGMADLAFVDEHFLDVLDLRVTYGSGATVVFSPEQVTGNPDGQLTGPLLASDLNRDGYTDLVFTGVPGGVLNEDQLIFEMFGSATGLEVGTLHTISAPLGLEDSSFGSALALVASPTPRLVVGVSGGAPVSGALVVYSLGTDGKPSGDPQLITPASAGILTRGATFGTSLASLGSQLFVGAPFTDVHRHVGAGAVFVLTFTDAGGALSQVVNQDTAHVSGVPAEGDRFGSSLAARDGYLAVGSPGDGVGKVKKAGSVGVFRIVSGRLVADRRVSQSSAGVPGTSEKNDQFGYAVAVGTVCPGVTGLVVGAPQEKISKGHTWDGSAWLVPLAKKSGCVARQLYQGHGLTGATDSGRRLGSAVAVIRDNRASVDNVVIAGSGSGVTDVKGRLVVWSAVTHKTLLATTNSPHALAGR